MSKRKQGAPKSEPKPKLRTMNEISAAETVKLFHAAMTLDDGDATRVYGLRPEGFPGDIAGKDFLDGLAVYCQLRSYGKSSNADAMNVPFKYDGQADKAASSASNAPEKTLELAAQLRGTKKAVFDRIVDGLHPQVKDFVNDETLISDETGQQMAEGTIRYHISTLCNMFDVPDRKALVDKFKSLLPPKAK